MSHSIEYYQQMNTEQLINEMNHAFWSVDRQRAQQVYQERIRTQKAKEQNHGNHQVTALNNRVNALQSTLNSLNHQNANLNSIIERQNTELRNMQRAHNSQVADMRAAYNRRIEDVSNQNYAALHALQNQMVNEDAKLRATIKDNFQRTTAMINEVNTDLTNRINAVHTELSAQLQVQRDQINNLENEFQGLHREDAELRENALEYLDAAIALINSTIEYNNENHHSWRSDDLNTLINLRSRVDSNLNGMLTIGTARDRARDLFEGALRYRSDVYADEREWQLRHAAAQQCIDAAYNDLEISRTVDADGMEIDVDYWTCGDLRRIGGKLHDLEMLLENPNLTHAELTGISELAETYRQEIRSAVTFAMQAVQCSIDRKELLEIAVDNVQNTLGTLHPEWEEYFAGDNRLGYRVYLTAPETGERVVLTAEPAKHETDLRNQFRFDILSTGHHIQNANAAAIFTQTLAAALSKVPGCEFTSPNCTNQTAPAADHGQGDNSIWRKPDQHAQETAIAQAAPAHAPHAAPPQPKPVHAFTPQPQI